MKKIFKTVAIGLSCSMVLSIPVMAESMTGALTGSGFGDSSILDEDNSFSDEDSSFKGFGLANNFSSMQQQGLASNNFVDMKTDSSDRKVALDDLNISILLNDYISVKQDDGFVYVYTMYDGSMPYVIIGNYDIAFDGVVDKFTAYMSGEYNDLDVEEIQEGININGKTFDKVMYTYTVNGNQVVDTRLFTELNGKVYMFGKKEVPNISYTVSNDVFEKIASSLEMLAGGDGDYVYHVDSTRSLTDEYHGEEVSSSDSTQNLDVFGGSGSDTNTCTTPDPNTTYDATTQTTGTNIFQENMASYQGVWCPFEDGFQLYLPSTWKTFILTDEAKANGCIYQAGDESALTDANAPYIEVNYVDVSPYNYTTLDDVKADLEQSGFGVDAITNVNDMDCVVYHYDPTDVSGLMFYGPKDSDLVFAVVAHNFKKQQNIQEYVLKSLKKWVG